MGKERLVQYLKMGILGIKNNQKNYFTGIPNIEAQPVVEY